MGKPIPDRAAVVVPLPDDADIARVPGDAYDPDSALNVLKMMAGTGNLGVQIPFAVPADQVGLADRPGTRRGLAFRCPTIGFLPAVNGQASAEESR
jgi:hypothetical protein